MVFEIADQEVVVTKEMQAVVDSEMAKLSKSQLNELVETVEEELATPSAAPVAGLAGVIAAISAWTKLGFFHIAQVCTPRINLCIGILKALVTQGPKAVNCARTSINQKRFTC